MNDMNKNMMMMHESQKKAQRDAVTQRNEMRKKEEERIRKEQDDAKNLTSQRMQIYKQTLDQQKQINEFNKGHYGTMSQVEKKFNKGDLW